MEISFLLDDSACAKLLSQNNMFRTTSPDDTSTQTLQRTTALTPPPTSTSVPNRSSPRKNRLPSHLSESFVIDSPKRACRSPYRELERSARPARATRSSFKNRYTTRETTMNEVHLQSPRKKHQARSRGNRNKRKRSGSCSSTSSSATDEQETKRQRYARRGKWLPEEEAYTITMIIAFREGLLPLESGTTLRSYVAKQLYCDPMRVTKKLSTRSCAGHPVDVKIGKSTFQPRKLEEKKKYLLQKLAADQARFAASAGITTGPLIPKDYTPPDFSPNVSPDETLLEKNTNNDFQAIDLQTICSRGDNESEDIKRLNVQELQALKGLIHLVQSGCLFTMKEERHATSTQGSVENDNESI